MSYYQTSWKIRPSQANDLTRVSQIFLQGFAESVLHYVGGSSAGIQEALQDIFTVLSQHQPQGFLVADAKGTIGGYVIAIPNMQRLWWYVLSQGHLWQWTKRWLQGDYGVGLVQVLALIRNKLGFALSQFRLGKKAPKIKGHTAQILSIAVDPSYRGQGIGHALLGEAISYLATTEATFVKLEVRPSNTAARKLYGSFGFQAISTSEDSQGQWIVMVKTLHSK
ncbi:MAG: GNAT family N-acetyltransferase [Firmicutes bacterium]|jgi:ribosomal protein S18 acetylase RimI-like enzyme|nr:GNAT family N-acetyltransferase [Bacillota bacterium]